ncbi:methyl-accepting chemotaxis protein [Pelomonas sp. CA6]|uniref:methyl-accepting chemotaxis protein n=1 Tax=Pelomonas sp. CA6 TaxID=2907999 RepID=UPI0024087D22|nr:methyl-accepting chemotaxis protein [Pelomonas sp. CA6]
MKNLRFSTRLLLCAVVPALFFLAAVGASLAGLFRTEGDFARLIERELAIANGFNEMYGQGLQMGQALRNIVLAPENKKAYANFDAAREAFDKALEGVRPLTAGLAIEASLPRLAELRQTQTVAQNEVLSLSGKDQAAAIAALNARETPAWRELRAEVLKQVEAARQMAEQAREETNRAVERSQRWAAALALLAALVAGVLLFTTQRTVRRELGGDPQDAAAALRRIASGDLSEDVPSSNGGAQSLMAELARMQESLRTLVGQVRGASESILVASSEVAQGSGDLSARTEQAASSLQETAASMEQITSSVRSSADAASTANQLVANAADTAGRGGQVVADVVSTMDDIRAGSRRIGDIIGVIDGIAFQTNILALNAAVEAARAGEQGRGFAVVAGEVRSLAQRSAEAAKEIKTLITASMEQVESGAERVGAAGQTMDDIVASVRRVNDVINEISAASAEQSSGIEQIGAAVGQLDEATQQNAALVEESAAAAESLKEQAQALAQLVGEFRLQPGR